MRILFAGSPAIAVPSLKAISQMESEGLSVTLAGILTTADRPRRHGHCEPSDVSLAAAVFDRERAEKGLALIPQLKFEKLDSKAREETKALNPDLLVSFAYARFFGPLFLEIFPLGGINIHPSLLPKYRGASPLQAAILAGEEETGICIQKLSPQLDSGDILSSERIPLSGRETTLSLSETVAEKAAGLLRKTLLDFKSLSARARGQEGDAVYCTEIKKEDALIDWTKSAREINARVRAFTPWPLSYTSRGKDTLVILEAQPLEAAPLESAGDDSALPGTVLGTDNSHGILIQTGGGVLAVSKLMWRTKKPLEWKAFWNGERGFAGTKLGSAP